MLIFGLLCFVAGAVVGVKYPDQVNKGIDKAKQLYCDLKDKLTKKETPPQA
jgi:hypothetical protein